MIDRATTGRVIRRLRQKKGKSQVVLSGLAGMHSTQLGAIERGQRGMLLETFFNIADALDMRPSELQALIEMEARV